MSGSQQFERADYAVCTDQFGLFQLARQQQVHEITACDRNAHARSVGLVRRSMVAPCNACQERETLPTSLHPFSVPFICFAAA
jgi:hypothetical protein